MSSEFEQLQPEPQNKCSLYLLLLSSVLGAETLISALLFYDFAKDLHRTGDSFSLGVYPLHCFQLPDPQAPEGLDNGDLATCDMMRRQLEISAQKRLLLDIRNALWQNLGEHNLTQSFKPAIHLTARHELNQYHILQNAGDIAGLQRVNWDVSSQISQMRLSPEGEIVLPKSGLYFVYSQVYFESVGSGSDPSFGQFLYRRSSEGSSGFELLSRAAAAPCGGGGGGGSSAALGLYTSQQGALFRLQRGDALALYVSASGAARFPPESTYFGAFIIN